LFLSSKTEIDAKTGEQTTTISFNFGAAVGIGLVMEAEINLPVYTIKSKY